MAAASGRLYVTTIDGRVICLCGEGTPLAAAPPARLAALDIAVKPASFEPGRKARPSLQADFARVVHAEVTRSALGYHLLAESELPGLALKKLPAPRQGKIDLTVRIRVANDGELMNGFLAFGDGPAENRLVKCGLRFAQRKAMIVEGPLGRGKISAKPFDADETQVYTDRGPCGSAVGAGNDEDRQRHGDDRFDPPPHRDFLRGLRHDERGHGFQPPVEIK